MNEIILKIKAAKDNSLWFVEGPNGEILHVASLAEAFPEISVDPRKFIEQRDAILNNNDHINHPERYVLMMKVPSSQGVLEMGLPPLTGEDLAKNDLRRGIQVVRESALKELKG